MPHSKPKTTTPILDKLRNEFQPKAARSLEEQLSGLDDNQMQSLTINVKMASMMYNVEDMKSYPAHVEKMYPKQSADRKRLMVRIMQELNADGEYKGEAKPEPDYARAFDDRTNLQLRGASQPKQKRGIGKNLSALMAAVKPT